MVAIWRYLSTMVKQSNDPNSEPQARTYMTAGVLAASAGLFLLIAYKVLVVANERLEETYYMFAAMAFALIWILTERVLKRTVFGVTLTTAWQDRLTFAIPVGFAVSIYAIPGVTGAWSIASQLIGGWVIVGCGAVLVDLLWTGIKTSIFGRKHTPMRKN
jgi:hypothetical protein